MKANSIEAGNGRESAYNPAYEVDSWNPANYIAPCNLADSIDHVESLRSLALNHIRRFPNVAEYLGLRKLKTRYMVNALIHGIADNGNLLITCYGQVFHYYYRGTLIYKWNVIADKRESVHAGDYEDTPSTRNQRKEIRKAIEHFREILLKL